MLLPSTSPTCRPIPPAEVAAHAATEASGPATGMKYAPGNRGRGLSSAPPTEKGRCSTFHWQSGPGMDSAGSTFAALDAAVPRLPGAAAGRQSKAHRLRQNDETARYALPGRQWQAPHRDGIHVPAYDRPGAGHRAACTSENPCSHPYEHRTASGRHPQDHFPGIAPWAIPPR